MATETLLTATNSTQPAEWSHDTATEKLRFLISSPYLEPSHQLDLSTLDDQDRIFALALTELHAATPDYATVKYEESFDLDQLVAGIRSRAKEQGLRWARQEFYVVEFRSQLKAVRDNALLFKLDEMSHEEANISGGLLKYWFGAPDEMHRNLATCEEFSPKDSQLADVRLGFWRSKEDAIKGGLGPWHKRARQIIGSTYERIEVKGLTFTITDGAEGWSLTPYK